MLPVRMMEIYWSAVQILRNRPEATVEATSPTVRFIKRINTEVMLPNIPLAVMAPPKHIAQIISQIVFIIPLIPRVETRSFKSGFPVWTWVLP